MIEPVAVRIDLEASLPLERPAKRLALYTVGVDGRPDILRGRFDIPGEIISSCAGSHHAYVVEVAHYAFLKVEDFSALFGPLR